ncbi:MAG TPA: type II secretion system protein [Candidatus Saccharibacteria bacterium]|nr:type II secretion system protein [Candidatus Saccharibacteria bacterium]HRQ97821.1 type II secretion system protein [Candidatus Saccharibacteria bacterium]
MIEKIKSLRNKESGFTIVELLIVIVVIGILAAITIVSYTGITTQANNAAYQQDASSIVSVSDAFYARTNAYPTTSADFTNASNYTKLPANITVAVTSGTVTGSVGADPCTAGSQTWAVCTNSSGVKSYSATVCAAGVTVYYLEGTSTLKTAKSGAGC